MQGGGREEELKCFSNGAVLAESRSAPRIDNGTTSTPMIGQCWAHSPHSRA